MKNIKINSLWYFLISFIYLELIFKVLVFDNVININLINIFLYVMFFTLLMKLITSFFKEKTNKIISFISIFIISFIFSLELCIYRIFGLFFDFSLLSASNQVFSFASDMVMFIIKNIGGIILLFVPFVVGLIFNKHISFNKEGYKHGLIILIFCILFYGSFLESLYINKNSDYSAHELYYKTNNIDLSINKLGVLNTFRIDLKRVIFGFNDTLSIIEKEDEEDKNIEYSYNNLDIDFDNLSNNSEGVVKNMHEFFKNETGTKKNKYTGKFKDKNLILFMAESFNEIAVDEKLTPTLYKLVNNGFVFKDFYTPTISSTIGGEFQELTGLVATSGFLTPWKKGTNTFPFGVSTVFENLGYNTYAYHDHTYTFQDRYKYLESLGFNNFKGCNSGMETIINCDLWPESDVEMIDGTINEFINNDKPFFTYYVTVSGHGDYNWSNAMSKKHYDEVKDLGYSEKVLAYLAGQIELDRALDTLIKKLDENGKLDDTVIALVGDHYPYYLTCEEVNELSKDKKDPVIEINHSNFILWNNKMDNVIVEKVGSQIDVLPTIYNLFDIPYDSRLIIGKDILSTETGLAIFGNNSWVSDYGTYFSENSSFIPKKDIELPENYIKNMNAIVQNKMNISKLIMTEDYYSKVF
ncbi:MAG: sulfatase-like hydrolase/transferase [Bacilli bacterium]